MEHSEMDETVKALYKLMMVQSGIIAAQRLMLDTVVTSLASLPTFVDAAGNSLATLGPLVRNDLEEESLVAFDNTVAHFEQVLGAVSRR